MKQNVSEHDFTNAFQQIRPDNFSYAGLQAMYEYFTDLEEDTGEEMELDVIAICCDFSEFDSLEEINDDYNMECESIEEVQEHTTVIVVPAFKSMLGADHSSPEKYIVQAW